MSKIECFDASKGMIDMKREIRFDFCAIIKLQKFKVNHTPRKGRLMITYSPYIAGVRKAGMALLGFIVIMKFS